MNVSGLRAPHILAGLLALLVLLTGALSACGGDDDDDTEEASPTAPPSPNASPTRALSGEITVFAASSLTEAFKESGSAFEKAHPGAKVAFSFASSSSLATQINEGAPADVFASADIAQMKVVSDKGNVLESNIFVKNTPVVVVPKGSTTVSAFADLAKPGVKLVLAGKEVPIGKYARDIFTKASGAGGVSSDFADRALANLKSEEANVRAVLTKVQLGEADAGIVYKTDIGSASNDVKVVDIPKQYNVIAEYPIAVVTPSKHAALASAFVAFIRSADGVAILDKYGFLKP